MNHSIYSADRQTDLKIVAIRLVCACFVAIGAHSTAARPQAPWPSRVESDATPDYRSIDPAGDPADPAAAGDTRRLK